MCRKGTSEDRKMSGAIETIRKISAACTFVLKQPANKTSSSTAESSGLDGEHKYDKRFRLCQTEEPRLFHRLDLREVVPDDCVRRRREQAGS